MENKGQGEKKKALSMKAVVSTLISIAFCAFLIGASIINKTNIEKLRLEQHIYERTHRINDIITTLLYKTQALAAIVGYDNGSMDSFEIIAPSIVNDPVIQNILLAPDGIVAKIYPYAENEGLIGWNYFDNRAGNMEAMAARDLGQLVLGGPMEILHGTEAIFGRMPVFIEVPSEDGTDETQEFWGLVSITLKFPEILERAELEIFNTYGEAYELWRINPDTNEKQVIADNYDTFKPGRYYIEKPVNILNAHWYLKVWQNYTWYKQPDNIAFIIAGFFISLIVFLVMQNNYDLKSIQNVFELMAITDHLTGISNRRHFLEIVRINIEKSRRLNEDCYFIMFDIDKFKDINDTYGHQIGDKVLMDVTTRIKTNIRPYDLFARYGGEEFLIFTSGINKDDVCEMTERLRLSLCSRKFEYDNVRFDCSASFGIAHMYDYNLDKAIKQSDDAMYAAKRNGRNCVVYFSEIES
jgi:diguanylate cyclase (GGDEF)-like protein